jgi:uncharacterized protein (DUF58 family)
MRSRTRGPGLDLAGARPYRPGDDVRRIDWRASARLSSTRDADEFVVREHLTEEATQVVLLVDRGPSMALFAPDLPWLVKPAAVAEVESLVAGSARRGGCTLTRPADGGDAGCEAALAGLVAQERRPPPGAFVFLVSDFLALPPDGLWDEAIAAGWDVVPIVVQDPVWEQSFPDVAGVLLPLADPDSGRLAPVRLSRAEARARREAHEARLDAVLARFEALGLDWAIVGSHDRGAVYGALLDWADGRHQGSRLAR